MSINIGRLFATCHRNYKRRLILSIGCRLWGDYSFAMGWAPPAQDWDTDAHELRLGQLFIGWAKER